MDSWKKGLTIHGTRFNYKELLAYCSDNIVSPDTYPWEKEIYRFIITWLSDRDHIVQFSSGTTGIPKEIILSKRSMMSSALITCNYLGVTEGNTALLCMPVDYIAGKMMLVRSFVCGLNLFLTEPKSMPKITVAGVIDFCAMVPLQVLNLLQCEKDLSPIRKLIIGGAEISRDLQQQLLSMTTEAYATYGMAETSSHIALKRLNGHNPQKAYQALPGVSFSQDDRGCLVIETAFLPEPVITNDLVELKGTESFNWLGRYDNLINSGGIKIVPEEVEAMVMDKTMLECMVIGLPDKKLGQKLVFVFEEDQIPDSFSSLKSDLENILPRRWKPKALITVNKFPRNDSMKADRRTLAEMLKS